VPLSPPHPSDRLLRAAEAEHAALIRHRERLAREREKLAGELRRVDEALASIDTRLTDLRRLVPIPGSEAGGDGSAVADIGSRATTGSPQDALERERRHVLRGPAIREIAVQVLIGQQTHIDALHYRHWYELVCEAGYAVAGKDPLAVFLTQVSRSPLVRKATQPGIYEVDRQAPLRIRHRLEKLQRELGAVASELSVPTDLAAVRARRHELDLAISQQERALEEALRVLEAPLSSGALAGANA
jgi:hypothetical protein